ncbi:hypothetical protein P691DRAFT_769423 [Macrolepiota fuliginosa MF-IS2]|uniref:Uncharacterized protein n=1 Tax=Macrolepiota fuliginosa MF-IS2 TaxID=1400762 RepID=A0A9P5WX94_9AGAR|nr:hypothetical protein P691DRAFT_769423 [Macrolepiota fuliginosa MF-IS2]
MVVTPCPAPIAAVQPGRSDPPFPVTHVLPAEDGSPLPSPPPMPVVGGSPSPPALGVEGSPSPLPIPHFRCHHSLLSPALDIHMSSLPPVAPAELFLSDGEIESSPGPVAIPPPTKRRRGGPSLHSAVKIPRSMQLQDAASKAHKKVILKLPSSAGAVVPSTQTASVPQPMLVSNPAPNPVLGPEAVPDAAPVSKPKAVHKEQAKVHNNKEFVRLHRIAALAPILSGAQHLFAVPSPEALGPLSSELPPCMSCLFQHKQCDKRHSQADELDQQKLTKEPPSLRGSLTALA